MACCFGSSKRNISRGVNDQNLLDKIYNSQSKNIDSNSDKMTISTNISSNANTAAFEELFGTTLVSSTANGGASTAVKTSEALAGKKAVAVYFSAHWCPPCRGFTPKLAEWYNKDLKAKGLEVVFVSSDRDEESFKSYHAEQPWLALPYEQRDLKAKLNAKYKVNGIPSLVILDSEGKVITKEGRGAISQDPTGEEFPWKPVPASEILKNLLVLPSNESVDAEKTAVKLVDHLAKSKSENGEVKALALYFSAHWCPPCRGFTPKLAEWYTKDLKKNGLEVLFISSDRDDASFVSYYKEQPWLALPFGDRKTKEKLSDAFKVSGIPTCVIVDPNDNFAVLNKDGRGAVTSDPTGAKLPWLPEPIMDLNTDGPGDINEVPTVCLFAEGMSKTEQEELKSELKSTASSYLEKQKAMEKAGEDADLELAFLIVTEEGGLAPRLRGMMNVGEKGNRFGIMDIPDEGGYYTAPESEVLNAENVKKFVADYFAKKLERKQLE